jgi:SAM-dependent methyltransferase
MSSPDPTKRFSDRAEAYGKYRPSYPKELVSWLGGQFKTRRLKVADAGSGTGIFSRLLLEAGCEVWGVEPNQAMREAAETFLSDFGSFHSIPRTAEDTGLPRESFDLVTAAQAFHWFHPENARREFLRLLKPEGRVALVWNNRETESPFGRDYETFLVEHSVDYPKVRARDRAAQEEMRRFFGQGGHKLVKFPHSQILDWEGLWGRFLSTSYSPKVGDARFEPAKRRLEEIFRERAQGGKVSMRYDAELFFGRPA